MKTDFFSTSKLPPYLFEAMHILKMQVAAQGVEIIDFGMGNPDLPPPDFVIEKMQHLVQNPKLYRYSLVGGIDLLKKAHCAYYQRRFGVDLDYKTQSLVTIGAKEGLTSLATALSGDDNYFVVPSPSYPIHTSAFKIAKTKVYNINAQNSVDFLQKFKDFVENIEKKPLGVIINFPCNPTTETVSLGFYQELVDFCRHHQIYIISDIAYCELYFDEKYKPCSILEAVGAKDVAIEFSTVSKSFSMGGARLGFAAGNAILVNALYKIKSYLDYSSFEPLQIAAVDCLSEKSDEYLQNLRARYKKRAEFLVKKLNEELGWSVEMSKATMFLWTKLPMQFSYMTSFDFCKKLLEETGVAISAGSGFGEAGEGFVRFSLIHDEEDIIRAIAKMKEFQKIRIF